MAVTITKQQAATVDDAGKAAQRAAAEECARTFHNWGLPAHNPFNSAALECAFACKRCGVKARFAIVVG
jgi:hypothetical protein